MNGVPLTLTLGLGFGAGVGVLLGFPIVGAGVGVTAAVVLAAVLDVMFSSAGSQV